VECTCRSRQDHKKCMGTMRTRHSTPVGLQRGAFSSGAARQLEQSTNGSTARSRFALEGRTLQTRKVLGRNLSQSPAPARLQDSDLEEFRRMRRKVDTSSGIQSPRIRQRGNCSSYSIYNALLSIDTRNRCRCLPPAKVIKARAG
jgi:hypothetical protein